MHETPRTVTIARARGAQIAREALDQKELPLELNRRICANVAANMLAECVRRGMPAREAMDALAACILIPHEIPPAWPPNDDKPPHYVDHTGVDEPRHYG